jgi:HEAT repeat protein
LAAWLRGGEPPIEKVSRGTLRRRDRAVVETILLDHARRVRGAERSHVARALDELGYVDRYLARMRSRSSSRRAEAAEKLGLSGAMRARDALASAMEDDSSDVRLRAAKSLGRLGGTASARELIRALHDSNRWSAIRIADILTGMGRRVLGELTAAFSELELPGKLAVLDILGRTRPLQASPWLARLLDDPEPDVRARACHALGCIGDPRQAPALVRALEDPEWPVRAMAAKALGRMRHSPALSELSRALGDGEWWVRTNAAQALRAMGRKGVEALERALESPDRFGRHQAVLMLQEMGVVDERVGRLALADVEAQGHAERFVERLIAAGQTERLHDLAADHADERVRRALHGLLRPEGEPAEAVR